jgi:subtilisin-like proprotein convertase family protein
MKKLSTFLKRISLISTFILFSQTAWSARYSSSAVSQLNNGQTVNPGTTGHQVLRVDLVGTGNNAGQSWDLNSIQFALTNNSNYSSAKLYYRSNNSNFGGATLISTINNPGASITFNSFSTTPTASGGSASTLYLWLVVDIKSTITCNGNSIDASVPSNGIDIGGNGGGVKTPTTNNPTGNGNISSSVTPSVSIATGTTTICAGTNTTFTASPTNGGSTPSYQWKINGNNAGTNNATFSTTALQNNDIVTCILTSNNACASPATATSNSITITVSATPTSTISPLGNQYICGSSGSLQLTANSNLGSGINYQWKKDGVNISGATGSTYNATTSGNYTVVISNSSNTSCFTESVATTVHFVQISASAILSDSSICYGSSAQLSATVKPGTNGGIYSNNNSFSIPDNNATGASSTISAGGLPSSLTGLTIRVSANVIHQFNGDVELYLVRPGGTLGTGSSGTNFRSPVAGQSILLSSDNGGSGQNYTGVIFSDAATTLISTVTGNQNITGEYRPEQLFSTLTGNPNGTWTLIAVDDAGTDVGTLTSWTIEFSYTSGITYSWTSLPSGFSSSIANPGTVNPTQTTTYIVNATETTSGCSVADSVTLTINGTVVPTASVTPSGTQNICPPQTSLTLTASSSLSSPTYQWYKNGTVIAGETGSTLSVISGGNYSVIASGIPSEGCVASSNEVPVFFHSSPVVQVANDTMICAGGTAQLTSAGSISETQQFTQGNSVNIPDNLTPIESSINVSNLPTSLSGVTVSVSINSTHTYNTDQEFYLVRPGGSYSNTVNGTNLLTTISGQSVVLSTDNGGSGDNYDVVFTDSAAVLVSSLSASNVTVNGFKRPEQLLSTLTGNPNGTWKLVALDDENLDAGILNSWTLTFTFSNGLSYSWISSPAGFTSAVQNPGAVNPIATTSYIVTVSDQLYGCSSNDTITVYLDTVPPVAQCKNVQLYLDANGAASITSADINNNSTDNCAIISLVAGQTSFTCANIGANTVSLTATDASGNSSSCNAIVTVLDTVSPVVNCQNITIYLDANGAASITAADINNNSTDNCAIISLVAGQTSFTCANIGANTVSLTATDASGNSSSCNAIVTVLDTVSPVVNCQNTTIYLDANGAASITAADINNNSTDNCAIISLVAGQTSFTCANIGANTVSLTATDASGNSSSCNAIVTVLDTVSPVVNCQNTTIYLDANGAASITAADINNNSTDNCAIISLVAGQTSFTCVNIGANTVSLTATDASGNSSSCNAIVTVLDTVSPLVNCQNITVYLDANGAASITAADINNNSTDNCAIISLVAGQTSFTCANIGANTVSLTATDASGNSSSCNAIVTVLDTVSPVANCQNITVYLDANGAASITAADINNNSTDNCAIISLVAGQTSFTCANIGANTVSLTATDASGNSSSCNAIVTVLDTISPVVNCQNINVYLDANGAASTTAADINNNSTDNCAIISLVAGQTSFTCANIGANTVSLTATDASGNSSSCNAIVTVLDTVSPVANCQNITVYLDANGAASITAADINNNSTDNCAIISLVAGQTSFTCANIGANTVSLTATDASGNSSSCNAIVTVLDTVSPVVNCQNTSIAVNETTGIALLTASDVTLNASDNCSYSLSVNPSSFDCTQLGNNTVTLTITDASGNVAVCQSIVTVTSNLSISGTTQDVNCYGASTGNIDITITGGSGNYTYLWSDNSTNEDLSNISSGTYTVTIFDATGCTKSATYQISEPDSLEITINTTNVSCNGFNDGTATSTISGGTTPYNYYWDNDGETTPSINGLYAGTYQLEITDANGCIKTANFEITEPAPAIVDAGSDGEVCAESAYSLNGYIDGSTTAAVWSTSGDGVFGDINALQTTYTPGINDSIAGSVILVLTGNNLNGLCPSKSDTLILTVNGKPAPATTILGPRSVCRGNSGNFSIDPTPNTDTYVWSYISGQDITISPSIDNLSAIVTFGNTITNSGSYIYVQGINQCGIGSPRQLWVRHDIGNPQFATPAQAVVCPNTTGIIYKVRKVQGADSLTWTVPSGCTYVQVNDTTISTDFGPSYTSGDLIVTAHFICGNTTLIRKITSGTSRVPGVISGPKNGLCDTTVTLSIAAVSGAASYNWTMPSGATIVGPANGTSISVYFAPGFTKSSIAVAGVNACGVISNTRTLQVSEKPSSPTVVTGPSLVCAGQQNIQYTVAPVPGANSYQWTVPSTATLVSGQGSNSIIVNWGSVTGSVNVKAQRTCSGLSTAKTHPVAVNCRQADIANNGISINNLYPNPNHGAFTVEVKATENTDARFILTDISGRVVLQSEEYIREGITTYPMSFSAESGTYILKVITSTGVSAIRFFAE